MKYILFFTVGLLVLISGCNKTAVDPNAPASDPKGVDPLTINRKITDGWNKTKGLGGGRSLSPKNHLYEFEVTNDNSVVDFSVSSTDIEIGYIVYDTFDQKLSEQWGSKSEKSQIKLNEGKYYILVYSEESNAVGNYLLTITGIPKIQKRITTNWLKTVDQSFGELGGGGFVFHANYAFNKNSPKNNYYTFEVTDDNSIIDLEFEANSADCWMKLYDANGTNLDYFNLQRGGNLIIKLNKGKYSVWVGTRERDAKTNYVLNIFGKVTNLVKNEFKIFKNPGTWPKKDAFDTYQIIVEKDNSFIDFNLTGNYDVDFVVFDSNNNPVSPANQFGNVYNRNGSYYNVYNIGTYEIEVYPSERSKEVFSGSKTYNLNIVGDVKSVSKK
jgi:hypothetical protein